MYSAEDDLFFIRSREEVKIAIVCGHFMPEVGYQEVYLARSFSKLGHEVCVITSNKWSPSARNVRKADYSTGLEIDEKHNYSILRLRARISVGANVVCIGLRRAVEGFNPDLVVVIAVGKLFPYPILHDQEARCYKLVALFGDNSDFANLCPDRSVLETIKSILLTIICKKMVYAKAIKSCDILYLYTPETEVILKSYLSKKLSKVIEKKQVPLTLGFDPNEFYFSATDRYQIRKKLNISVDEVALITSTRVTERKNLERVIDIVSKLYAEGRKIRYIIVGFFADRYGHELKAHIDAQPHRAIFHCYPFLGHEEIRRLYCASDIGIWLKAAISIQEAMGTGLPVLLENKSVVKHLIQEGLNGWYFEQGKLLQKLKYAISEIAGTNVKRQIVDRKHIARINARKLSYDYIAQKIVEHM